MEKEKKLLEQAKFLYPVGTTFKNASNESSIKIVPNKPVYNNITSTSIGVKYFGWLLFNGKWAEVISRPEEYIKVIDSDECYSSHELTTSSNQPIYNKTYKVKDRIIFGFNNPYGTYVIEANGEVFVIGHKGVEESTKEQFNKDWNKVEFEDEQWYSIFYENDRWIFKTQENCLKEEGLVWVNFSTTPSDEYVSKGLGTFPLRNMHNITHITEEEALNEIPLKYHSDLKQEVDNIIDFDNFPKEGCFKGYNEELARYLFNITNHENIDLYSEDYMKNKDYITWNLNSLNIWFCDNSSKPKFTIKQQPMEKKKDLVVHVPYIEMYNFVKDNSNIDNYDTYKEETCLMPNDYCISEKNWFEKENYKVTPFKDWLKQSNNESKWQDYLFELAKERYPIGCTITSLVGEEYKEKLIKYEIYQLVGSSRELWLDNDQYNLQVYEDGKWAEFTEPEVKPGLRQHLNIVVQIPSIPSACFLTENKKREYYIPKQEIKEVKKVVQYVSRERNKSIIKY